MNRMKDVNVQSDKNMQCVEGIIMSSLLACYDDDDVDGAKEPRTNCSDRNTLWFRQRQICKVLTLKVLET